ncbi:MAG: WG repeat-containing protein [Bacteroidota bacterium]|nr:MAG: WG repeat-containing protein [Bacteroidota bacterium]
MYSQAFDFSEGLAPVCLGKPGYINRSNQQVIPVEFDKAFPFKNGSALVMKTAFVISSIMKEIKLLTFRNMKNFNLMQKVLVCTFCFLLVMMGLSNAQSGQWVWVSGSSSPNSSGNYGVKGVSAPGNMPPARYQAAYWIDKQGNYWIFGGSEASGFGHNDLWRYSVSTGEWTWMSGEQTGVNPMGNYGTQGIPSTTNYPPALGFGSNCWTDTAGNLWLFGGFDQSNFINSDNLWRYTITTNEWTWVSGSGTLTGTSPIYGPLGVYGPTYYPGSRAECKSGWVIDNELWLFGGQDNTSGAMSDLWSYNTLTNQWAWKGGSSNVNAPGNYGTLGVASPTNEPPARCSYTKWKDADNNLYLFAGGSFFGFFQVNGLNDTWKYDLQTKLWTWINGSNSIDHPGMTPAFCQPDATKYPRPHRKSNSPNQ